MIRGHRAGTAAGEPLSLAAVLTEEAAVFGTQLPAPDSSPDSTCGGLRPLYLRLNQTGHAALCLSGGGIRSAAFSLGVIQRFAAERLAGDIPRCALSEFQYLSTVSGGGYIGAWLSAWLMRARIDAKDGIGAGSADVLARLADATAAEEASAIANVRANSNYLTPKVGAMSADAWADVATYIRNLLLNWLVVAPLVAFLVLLVKLLHWGQYAALTKVGISGIQLGFGFAALLLMLIPLSFQSANRPTVGMMNVGQRAFLCLDLLIMLIAALVLSTALCSHDEFQAVGSITSCQTCEPRTWLIYVGCTVGGALLYSLAWFAAPLWRRCPSGPVADPRVARRFRDLVAWMIAGAIFGAALGVFWHADMVFGSLCPTWFVVILGVPWVLLARIVAEIAFVGLASSEHRSGGDREWFARAGGWYVAALITWFVVNTLVLFAWPLIVLLQSWGRATLVSVGGISGLITLLLGKSPLSAVNPNQNQRSRFGRISGWALKIATPIFAGTLLIAVSATLDSVLLGTAFTNSALVGGDGTVVGASEHPRLMMVIGLVLTAAVTGVAGLHVDINQFSLHALYRDRLVRCFLAASRHDRPYRNLFTDFDHHDNPAMHSLGAEMQPDEAWQPLHIINAALNIVSTRNLAWQERKAESFTFSRLHCGSACLPYRGAKRGSYRETESYGRGIRLGTAMAISGAAVSPNMGYHSSPAVTFFMAVFNVRLGWWLGNPGPAGARSFGRKGPRFATGPLIHETFGLTNDDHPYVYLSDGGHFEDLGLYEMVRRRCRFIVAVDAGCDPDLNFADLGNAVRKIWLDHRVRVTFRGLDALRQRVVLPATAPLMAPYHAIGQIHYAEADGPPAEDGWILYLKPSLHGIESADVLAYAAANQTFPHETTADQWFSESQFESYRALGFQEMGSVLDAAAVKSPRPFASLEQILTSL